MMRWFLIAFGILGGVLSFCRPAPACSICNGGNPQAAATLRQDASQAKLVLYGTLTNPQLQAAADALAASGTTDLKILKVLKSDPFLGDKKIIQLPRYVPITDVKDPPKYLVFCDIYKGKLDPFRGVPVKSAAVVEYLEGALALKAENPAVGLRYFFDFLDHRDADVSNDAFLEFAKASDQEVGQVASKLSANKLRGWLQDTQTPAIRLNLYALLLGACGADQDAVLLRSFLEKPTERTQAAIDGILAGYIQLRPREGWDLAFRLLRDDRKPFTERYAVLRTLRFYHGAKPEETRRDVMDGLRVALLQGDLADLAIEDLRRWKLWELTGDVLAQYGKKSHDVPIVRRTIVRYALSCPRLEANQFVVSLRKSDADLVKDVEESLQYEK